MKKVLIVTFTMGIGGLENVLMNYYRNINKNIFQLDYVVNYSDIKSNNIREIEETGGNVIYIKTPGQLGPIEYVRQLYKIIKQYGPYTAVHANNEYHGGLVALASKLAGVKNRIVHSHTTSTNNKRNMKLMHIYRWMIKKNSTLNLACSQNAGIFLFKDKFEVLPNAINVKKFQDIDDERVKLLRSELNISSNTIILGHIGRFSKEKNHKFLVDIMSKLVNKNSNYCLVFIGDGELRDSVEAYSKEQGVYSSLRFLGFKNNVNEYLSLFDILLLPSFYEGLPLTIVEAQAAGTQSLISRNITHEIDLSLGIVKFISIDNIDEWIKVITTSNSPNLTKKIIEQQFDVKKYNIKEASKLLETYYINGKLIERNDGY